MSRDFSSWTTHSAIQCQTSHPRETTPVSMSTIFSNSWTRRRTTTSCLTRPSSVSTDSLILAWTTRDSHTWLTTKPSRLYLLSTETSLTSWVCLTETSTLLPRRSRTSSSLLIRETSSQHGTVSQESLNVSTNSRTLISLHMKSSTMNYGISPTKWTGINLRPC
jgi:hypothetical protein